MKNFREYAVYHEAVLTQDKAHPIQAREKLNTVVADDIESAFLIARFENPNYSDLFLIDMGPADGVEPQEENTENDEHEDGPETERGTRGG